MRPGFLGSARTTAAASETRFPRLPSPLEEGVGSRACWRHPCPAARSRAWPVPQSGGASLARSLIGKSRSRRPRTGRTIRWGSLVPRTPSGRRFCGLRFVLFRAEPLHQDAATPPVSQKAGALVRPRLARNLEVIAPGAAVGSAQGRIVLAPGVAAARAARLFGAGVALGAAQRPAAVAVASSGGLPAAAIPMPVAIAIAQHTAQFTPLFSTQTHSLALRPCPHPSLPPKRGRVGEGERSDRRAEIAAGPSNDLGAELFAEISCRDFLDGAFRKRAQPERPEFGPDQPIYGKPKVGKHVAYLAVLAFADREGEPDIRALLALECRLDRAVVDAVDGDAVPQPVQIGLADPAMGADPITPDPAGLRQFQHPGEPAIVGEQQKALGADIEPPDAHEPRQALRQSIEHRRAALRIGVGAHEAGRLVIKEQSRALAARQRLAVNRDAIAHTHVHGRRPDGSAIDGDAARRDPFLGSPSRAQPRPRHHLRDAVFASARLRGEFDPLPALRRMRGRVGGVAWPQAIRAGAAAAVIVLADHGCVHR